MLRVLAQLCMARPRVVLGLAAVLFALAGALGWDVFPLLKTGGFDDPSSEASRAAHVLHDELGAGAADLVVLYTIESGTIDDIEPWAGIVGAETRIAKDPGVADVNSYFSSGQEIFLSKDRRRALVFVALEGAERDKFATVDRLRPLLSVDGLTTEVGGFVPSNQALNRIVQEDLYRAELYAFPFIAVLLVLIFRSLVAALLPLILGGIAIVSALAVLGLASRVTEVSVFATNMASILGLGLAVDYSLFVLNRYREEVPERGHHGALRVAMTTTGRAVVYSGVTVACSLAVLFLFPQMYLRSMAIGGIAVTVIAVLLSVTVLPAFIALLGKHVARGSYVRDGGFWSKLSRAVMRRPIAIFVVVVAGLLTLAVPFGRFLPSSPDVRMLSSGDESRRVYDVIDSEFTANLTTPHELVVVADGDLRTPENVGHLYDWVARVRETEGIPRVLSIFDAVSNVSKETYMRKLGAPVAERDKALESALGAFLSERYARVIAISDGRLDEPASQAQVAALRALAPPPGMRVLVGGEAARLHDLKKDIVKRVPWMLVMIGALMFVVLFLVFGSVTLPLKAMLMNGLSLTASFGAIVWVFQDGRFEGLFAYESLGTSDAMQPILMFAAVFGLSMDYEVLILSRVREEYLRTGDNEAAVARGLERTGRLITAAAALLVVVIGAFATSQILIIKVLGVGMALAITLDATIVRALLVPATMQLMGSWNWWAPAPLRRVWDRVGLGDLESYGLEEVTRPPGPAPGP
jgi:RND superfamily putative drug exporter